MDNNNTMQTSKKAIASLIFSILWLLGIGSLIAVVLGHQARSEIKKNTESLKGKGIALAGLIIGYIGIAIIVLGILSSVLVPMLSKNANMLNNNVNKARHDITCLNMKIASSSLQLFMLDNFKYPTQEEGFQALLSNPNPSKYTNYSSSAYLRKLPIDAWKTPMIYQYDGKKFNIMSLGADKKEGGTGENKDILYSECK